MKIRQSPRSEHPMSTLAFQELTPTAFLVRAAAVYADSPAVVDGEFRCSYAELYDRAQRCAGLLVASGVQPGDRVAVLCPNTHVLLESHYGVPFAGAVLVAMNTRLAPSEIAYIIDHCGARAVVVDDEYEPQLRSALALTDAAPVVITATEYDSRLPESESLRREVTDERSLLSLNYTSGTTGRPKGVMYHHRGAYLQAIAMAFHAGLTPDSTYLWTLPMFHTNGWCFPWAVTAAGAVHHCLRKIDPAQIWSACSTSGVTHFCAAPTVLTMLADHPDAHTLDTAVRVFCGGAPPWPALLTRMSLLGFDIQHLYGLTETFGPAVICETPEKWASLPDDQRALLVARQGIANIVSEPVRVIDASGNDVPPDATTMGEIALRGNNVMLGYYHDDVATAAATVDGNWFRTGDLGVLHPDGYIELRDRAKDVIISGGENITSIEVENALTAHPDVLEAAVVGKSDQKWGEIPIAFVSKRTGSELTESELVDFVRGRIARFKAPRSITFGDLPKTSTGKLQKNVLRSRTGEVTPH
jgi:fatty-acyl-CoA synthase